MSRRCGNTIEEITTIPKVDRNEMINALSSKFPLKNQTKWNDCSSEALWNMYKTHIIEMESDNDIHQRKNRTHS